MNRYTIHLDVFADDPADAWKHADNLAATATSAYAVSLTTADDWGNHVEPPQDQP